MAEVFRGFDPSLDRTVAIKVLLPPFDRDAGLRHALPPRGAGRRAAEPPEHRRRLRRRRRRRHAVHRHGVHRGPHARRRSWPAAGAPRRCRRSSSRARWRRRSRPRTRRASCTATSSRQRHGHARGRGQGHGLRHRADPDRRDRAADVVGDRHPRLLLARAGAGPDRSTRAPTSTRSAACSTSCSPTASRSPATRRSRSPTSRSTRRRSRRRRSTPTCRRAWTPW